MTVVRAAAVQISPVLYSRSGTVGKIVDKIRELGERGVRFAVFPETVIPYYPYFSFVQPPYAMSREHLRLLREAVTVPSPATDAIADAARETGMVVSVGVSERDGGTLYNTQLLFDADGTLIQRRRKITPTYHERMIWGQGDGSGLRAVDSAVGRIGQLACWEHHLPLARYALIADGEQIHAAMYPGAFGGRLARRRPAGAHRPGHRRPRGPGRRRLLHRRRRPRGPPRRRPAHRGRGGGRRRPGLRADRPAQAADGRARPLQPPRAAQPADRPDTGAPRPRPRPRRRGGRPRLHRGRLSPLPAGRNVGDATPAAGRWAGGGVHAA
ncbi:nitrilase-related carbon-nitrogen hydrolase [Streptomyces erythrochromogenes]|uniref:nitrilase-related carbon-nitrogen hydrolase n=1 Tax=Streptomyces erythrochromogenes TaxID=285574 RepID=UPI00342547CA